MQSRKIACNGCDLLIELPLTIDADKKWSCPRCLHTITRGHKDAVGYALAIAISCLISFALSYSFSFIAFDVSGQYREIKLIQTILELYNQGYYFLAILVFALIAFLPVVYLYLLLRILLANILGTTGKDLSYVAKSIHRLIPWLMVDVFLIGVLVALIKMWGLAHLSFGLSFWAYIVFVMQFSYLLYLVDQHKLWQWVKDAQ